MQFKIEVIKKVTIPIDVRLEKTKNDIVLRVNGLYVFAIKKDGTGVLYSGLKNNDSGLIVDANGKLKIKSYPA